MSIPRVEDIKPLCVTLAALSLCTVPHVPVCRVLPPSLPRNENFALSLPRPFAAHAFGQWPEGTWPGAGPHPQGGIRALVEDRKRGEPQLSPPCRSADVAP